MPMAHTLRVCATDPRFLLGYLSHLAPETPQRAGRRCVYAPACRRLRACAHARTPHVLRCADAHANRRACVPCAAVQKGLKAKATCDGGGAADRRVAPRHPQRRRHHIRLSRRLSLRRGVGPHRRCAQGPTTQNCSALQRIATQSLPPARLDCPCEPMSPCRRVPSGARRRSAPRTPARVRTRNASHTTTCRADFRRRAVAEWRTAAHRTRPRARGGCSELCGQACIGVGLAHERAVPVRWRGHARQEGARRPTTVRGR
jgi:hypothetical protein